ncbi:Acetyltransferase (GNAT) family protein [Marininema mesophilum]|uniref:Acetyltransferase (GNAT) family protein n=1 Tax=Marininema mesophilum TaxID=1048340 RepID=A0A1H3A228_9BACL|nr:GNAT family N-acetyltransferase [Marininema mesophilum]SDX23268.1 Acetyltransferase (GNAT) family protein [Marininema mesophilum]
MQSISQFHSRRYSPENDAEKAEEFHLALMRHHYRLWSELKGEKYDPAYWDRILIEEKEGARWREELGDRAEDENAYIQVYTAPGSDVPIGILFLDIRRDHLTFRNEGYINEIYLSPEYQGQGLSRQILMDGEAWFAEKGISSRQVFVTANNLAAVRLYERLGYQVIDYRMAKKADTDSRE